MYTEEELSEWWPAICPECGWKGLSRDCEGGRWDKNYNSLPVICPKYLKHNKRIEVKEDVNIGQEPHPKSLGIGTRTLELND